MRRKVLIVSGTAFAAIALYPLRETVAPEWRLAVADESGTPMAGVTVREVWQDYTVESQSHEEDRTTDAKGNIIFEKRTARFPLIRRAYGVAWNVVSTGAHASFGPHASLVIGYPAGYGNNDAEEDGRNEAVWVGGSGVIYKSLILHHCRNGLKGIVCMQ